MSFSPFDQSDFDSMKSVRPKKHIETLKAKTEALRNALAEFPEFELNFFKHRIARRPKMRGRQGLVFGPARWDDQHWYLSTWVEIKTKSNSILGCSPTTFALD